MPTIIMSVKRRHLQNMKRGIKRYELRKTLPLMTDGRPCTVLLCESGSGGWITGEFTMDGFVDLTHADPMTVARLGCISMAEAERYQKKGRGRLYG